MPTEEEKVNNVILDLKRKLKETIIGIYKLQKEFKKKILKLKKSEKITLKVQINLRKPLNIH